MPPKTIDRRVRASTIPFAAQFLLAAGDILDELMGAVAG